MRIAHCADFHLAPAGSKLDPETGLNARMMDRYRCARFCIKDAVERGADLILVAGDVFDSPNPSSTQRRLALQTLQPAFWRATPVVVLMGNHEVAKHTGERNATDHLEDVDTVTVVERPGIVDVYNRADGGLTALPRLENEMLKELGVQTEDLRLQIACLPYPNRQLLLAKRPDLGVLSVEQAMREAMMDVARGLAAELEPGIPSVLLGHFSVDLAEAGSESRLMALGADWTLNAHEVAGLGFDAVLLAHIHKPQTVLPQMHYCGSPEAMDFGEEGERKSYSLVDIDEHGVSAIRVPTPYRKFRTVDLASDPWPAADELREAIVKVRVPAGMDTDDAQMRRELDEAGAHDYTIIHQPPETVRRREVEVNQDMPFEKLLRAWAELQEDVDPDALVAEATELEGARQEAQA